MKTGVPRHPTFYAAEEVREGCGVSRPAAGTCSCWSRSPARGRFPGLREGQFRAFSLSDVTETPPFTPSPKQRPGGGGSGEAAGPRATLRASPRGRAASRAAAYVCYMCTGAGSKYTYSSVSVCVCISAVPCGLSCGAGSSEAPPPRPAVLRRLSALPSPGAAPGKRLGPWLRFQEATGTGNRRRHVWVSVSCSPGAREACVCPHLRGTFGYFLYRRNITELLPPATQ